MSVLTRLRRSLALIAGVLALVLALSACGTSGKADPTAGSAGLLPAAEGKTAYPLTLTTNFGETVLPKRPERIAIVGGLGELESFLAMGATPVVTSSKADDWPWFAPYATQLKDATLIDPWADALNVEAIAAAKPDLIVAITLGTLSDEYQKLTAIAPVLAIKGDTEVWKLDWKTITRALAAPLDLTAAGEASIAKTEQYLTDGAAKNPQYRGKTISFVMNRGQEAGLQLVNIADSPLEGVLSEMGFAQHPQRSAVGEGDISLENLKLVEADALLVARHGGRGTVEEASAWLEGSEIFKSLDVVKRGDVAFIDPDATGALPIAWAMSYPNQLTIPYLVDQLNGSLHGVLES